jgi:hypothetical protein
MVGVVNGLFSLNHEPTPHAIISLLAISPQSQGIHGFMGL